jgi:FKBP-type peptidyl-prolyl cis-trans isomerase
MTWGLCTPITTWTPKFSNGSPVDDAAPDSHARYPRTAMTLKASMTAVAAAAAVLGLAACGGSSKTGGVILAPGSGPTNTTISSVTATTTTATTTATTSVATPTSGPLAKEPTITLPKGAAPTKLVTKDLIKGTGTVAASGDTVYVNYVGELYKGGKVFDASWKDTPGKTFSFVLGQGQVISGWDKGVAGMKVGGRRELIIPPSLAYGSSGQGSIPANATLIFVVDLVKVTK